MSKKKVNKKRKKRISIAYFFMVAFAWLVASLFIKTTNASLTMEIQQLNDELAELTNQNQTLNYEIQSLENKDRIYEVAEVADMSQVKDNIISIIGE